MPRNNRTSNPLMSFFKGLANLLGRTPSHERLQENQRNTQAHEQEREALISIDADDNAPKLLVSGLNVPEVPIAQVDLCDVPGTNVLMPTRDLEIAGTDRDEEEVESVIDNPIVTKALNEIENILHRFSIISSDIAEMKDRQAQIHTESKDNFEQFRQHRTGTNNSLKTIKDKQEQHQIDLEASINKVDSSAQEMSRKIGNMQQTSIAHQNELKASMTQFDQSNARRAGELQASILGVSNRANGIHEALSQQGQDQARRAGELQASMAGVSNRADAIYGRLDKQGQDQERRAGELQASMAGVSNLLNALMVQLTQLGLHQTEMIGQFQEHIFQGFASMHNIQAQSAAQITRMSQSMFKAAVTHTGIYKIKYDQNHMAYVFQNEEGLKLVGFKFSDLRVLSPNETKGMTVHKYSTENAQELLIAINRDMVELSSVEAAALPQFSEGQFYHLSSAGLQSRLGR